MEQIIFWKIVFIIIFIKAFVYGERVDTQSAIVYTKDQLLVLGSSAALPTAE